jgi:DNA polymerase I
VIAKHPKSSPHLRVRVPGTGTILPDYDAYEKLLLKAYETVVSSLVNVNIPASH